MQLNFGVGTAVAKRTDVANNKPVLLGVLQDLEIDFSQSVKELIGQYKLPVDVAPAALKITGKAKFARMQIDMFNALMFGNTLTAASGTDLIVNEAHTMAATTYTVAFGATFIEDQGVFYQNTGIQLQPISAAPGLGQYIPGAVGVGTYTVSAGDNTAALYFNYTRTVTTLISMAGANALMGSGPQFELLASNTYTVQGVVKTMYVKLNACRATKMNTPFKNMDYTIVDFEFQAFMDASLNWGTLALSE